MLKWTSSYSAANVHVKVAQARAVSAFQSNVNAVPANACKTAVLPLN